MWKVEKIVSKGDYYYALVRDHPNSTKNNYVLLHRIVMENHLGRFLGPNEVVHHKNEVKKDCRLQNLQLLNNSNHARKHQIGRGILFCKLRCPSCKRKFWLRRNKTHIVKPTNYTCCSNSCRGKFSRYVQLYGKTHKVKRAISVNLIKEVRFFFDDNTEETG